MILAPYHEIDNQCNCGALFAIPLPSKMQKVDLMSNFFQFLAICCLGKQDPALKGKKTLGRVCLLVVSKWRPHNMIDRLSFPHRLFLPARVHRDVFHGVEQAVMAGEA